MRDFHKLAATALLVFSCATGAFAQQSQPTSAAAVPEAAAVRNAGAVPNVIRFCGSFHSSNGMPAQPVAAQPVDAQPVESLTLSIYRDQTGGAPLWQETQNVAVDGEGKYSVLMGSTQNDGVPLDLLSAGEPRWLGVQFNRPGEAEQPRVLMASVPYALKSVDAETLGGKPASAYLLAGAASSTGTGSIGVASGIASSAIATTTVMSDTTGVKPRTISGQAGFVPYFTDASNDLGDSVIQQSGGFIGIGTVPGAGANTTPSLDVRTLPFSQIGMAQTVDYLTFFSSDIYGPAIYWNPGKDLRFGKGGNQLYGAFGFSEQMRIQSATGNLGIGTMAPVAKLEVNGNVQADGNITIATAGSALIFSDGTRQTTAGGGGGGGGISGVTAGTDLTGGGTSGTVTLNLDTTKVPTLAGANTFTAANNSFTGNLGIGTSTPVAKLEVNGPAQVDGNVTITTSGNGVIFPNGSKQTVAGITGVTAGSDLTGGGTTGTVTLNLDTTKVPTLAGANTFTGSGNFFTAGNVGIGTVTPAATLDVNGGINAAGSINYGGSLFAGGLPILKLPGSEGLALGIAAQQNNTTAIHNTAVGFSALSANSSGTDNTAVGTNALTANTAGNNTAVGSLALQANQGGGSNTAVGYSALNANAGGSSSTAVGFGALQNNTVGANTAVGFQALQASIGGSGNTALGYLALANGTTGNGNTAVGSTALQNNLGNGNTAVGFQALVQNGIGASGSQGSLNTAVGWNALELNTTGAGNTVLGQLAMQANVSGGNNVAVGNSALARNTSGGNNIAIGISAAGQVSTSGSNNIEIGTGGASDDSGVIRIGGNTALGDPVAQSSFFVAGVTSSNLGGDPNAVVVVIDTMTGQLGILTSSRRYKEDIQDMGDASRGLMNLRPVTYRYKQPSADGSKPVQYGLIAEEVDEVYPDLVAHSADGRIETVKYQVLDSMLLNEVQKQYQHAQQQDATIQQQNEQIRKLEERLTAMEALLSGKASTTATALR